MIEEWRDYSEFEDFYQVSSEGRIRSKDRMVQCSKGNMQRLWRGKLLKMNTLAGRGYISVSLSANGKTYKKNLHRLIAKTFIDNPKNKSDVNHKNSIKTDNRVINLEWMNPTEHALFGYYCEGKSTPRKLNKVQVKEIKNLLSKMIHQKDIAGLYGVTQSAISHINIGKTWYE